MLSSKAKVVRRTDSDSDYELDSDEASCLACKPAVYVSRFGGTIDIGPGYIMKYMPAKGSQYPKIEFLAATKGTQTRESHGRDCDCFREVPTSHVPAMSQPVSKPVSACLKAPKGKQHQVTQTKTIIEVDEIILEKAQGSTKF